MEFATLDQCKDWLNLNASTNGAAPPDTSKYDDTLNRLIASQAAIIQGHVNRDLGVGSRVDVANGGSGTEMPLSSYPVVSVESVEIDGRPIAAAEAFGDSGFEVVGDSLILRGGLRFNKGKRNVVVRYTAGYTIDQLPELNQACIEMVGIRFRERDRIGQLSKTLEGQTVAFFAGDLTPAVKKALCPFVAVFSWGR